MPNLATDKIKPESYKQRLNGLFPLHIARKNPAPPLRGGAGDSAVLASWSVITARKRQCTASNTEHTKGRPADHHHEPQDVAVCSIDLPPIYN
jgi:hypothetical protein